MISDLFNTTVAQAIAWILGTGIVCFVGYGLAWVDWSENVKKAIAVVLTAVLTALVTSLASLIPDAWQTMRLIDAAFALVAMLGTAFGAWHFGEVKAEMHSVEIEERQGYVAAQKRIAE